MQVSSFAVIALAWVVGAMVVAGQGAGKVSRTLCLDFHCGRGISLFLHVHILLPLIFKTGYFGTVYFSDAVCSTIKYASYTPLGVCVSQGSSASVLYTSDSTKAGTTTILQTYYSTSSTCASSTPSTNPVQGNSTCVRSTNSNGAYVQNVVFAATFPTTLASSAGVPVFPYRGDV